jgi:hypothetical protein
VFGLRTTIARALDPVGAAIAGVVIARIAEPTMTGEGVGAVTIGRVIGTGAERGAALVAIAVGVAVAVLAVVQHRLLGDSIDAVRAEPAIDPPLGGPRGDRHGSEVSGIESVTSGAPAVSAA